MRYSVAEVTHLTTAALENAGAAHAMARAAAAALVAAEMEGLAGHGVSRTQLYARHLREGRTNGKAEARIVADRGAACLVDAGGGLAYEAG
ncbi:MAG TPA: Ldh family oxidoreductase, partial [Opitutaceae bacterium]|nr:Ldh family oxidoreductase [Opitutaceae bacterium]